MIKKLISVTVIVSLVCGIMASVYAVDNVYNITDNENNQKTYEFTVTDVIFKETLPAEGESIQIHIDAKLHEKPMEYVMNVATVSVELTNRDTGKVIKTGVDRWKIEGVTHFQEANYGEYYLSANVYVEVPANTTNHQQKYDVDVYADDEHVWGGKHIFVEAKQNTVIKEDPKPKAEKHWSQNGIKLSVNGTNVEFPDQKPLLDSDASRTYIPVRFLAEALGAIVSWEQDTQTVRIRNIGIEGSDTKTIHCLKIGENKIVSVYQEGSKESVANVYYLPEDIYPLIVGDRTMLPFRYIAEIMGAQVYYDQFTHTAHAVQRDMSQYTSNLGFPIFSTLIDQYWLEELFRIVRSNKEIYFEDKLQLDGNYSDMSAWAAIDKTVNPFKQGDAMPKSLHYHLHDPNFEGCAGIYEGYDESSLVFFERYLPRYESAFYSIYSRNHGGYGEVAFSMRDNERVELAYGGKNPGISEKERKELDSNWGIRATTVKVYNDDVYREIVDYAIYRWKASPEHYTVLDDPQDTLTGIAIAGKYAYSSFQGVW